LKVKRISEPGVISKAPPVARVPASVAAAGNFAARIARRYSPQAHSSSRAELALAWEHPAIHSHSYGSPHIHIAPSILFEERYETHGAARHTEREVRLLFERIFSRETRVSSFGAALSRDAAASGAVAGRREVERLVRPEAVERILPQPAPPKHEQAPRSEDQSTSTTTQAADGWGTPFTRQETPQPIRLPAPEIHRVAEQVMREIDHRITAQRERRGKAPR
jgi:hypothetical protein